MGICAITLGFQAKENTLDSNLNTYWMLGVLLVVCYPLCYLSNCAQERELCSSALVHCAFKLDGWTQASTGDTFFFLFFLLFPFAFFSSNMMTKAWTYIVILLA